MASVRSGVVAKDTSQKVLRETKNKRAAGTLKRNGAHNKAVFTQVHTLPATDKITLIKSGMSKNQLEELKQELSLDYDTLSRLLAVSRATLINKKGRDKFDQPTSERIMLLADIIAYGQEVFGEKAQFNSWMRKQSKALGDKTPMELMDTVYGMQEIKKELGRIEYGVF